MRYQALILLFAITACKSRDPQASDAASDGSAFVASEQYKISCAPKDPENESAPVTYLLETGPVTTALTQSQLFKLTVAKYIAGVSQVLSEDPAATGNVSTNGPVIVSFTAGVLNAEPSTPGEHVGLLTIFGEVEADSLDVRCRVALKDPQG